MHFILVERCQEISFVISAVPAPHPPSDEFFFRMSLTCPCIEMEVGQLFTKGKRFGVPEEFAEKIDLY